MHINNSSRGKRIRESRENFTGHHSGHPAREIREGAIFVLPSGSDAERSATSARERVGVSHGQARRGGNGRIGARSGMAGCRAADLHAILQIPSDAADARPASPDL